MKTRTHLTAVAALTFSSLSFAQVNMGMVGDSMTDDYLGGPSKVNNNLAAYSWGQVLGQTRSADFNFGGYKSTADGSWDTATRYSGYEYNYATSGGVASDNTVMNISGFIPLSLRVDNNQVGSSYLSSQTAGLATEISAGNVGTSFVGIGSNDFFYKSNTFNYSGDYSADPSTTYSQAYIDDIASSILSGVDTLQAAGQTDILLALLPEGSAGGSTPEMLAAIDAVNQQLIAGATARGDSVAIVDMWGWNTDPGRVDSDGAITIGELIIELDSKATAADLDTLGTGPCTAEGLCATDSHALNFSAEDGLHPNSIIQALMANQVIDALNSNFGHDIALLSDREIMAVAGISEVPVPAAAWLFGSALLGLAGIKRKHDS